MKASLIIIPSFLLLLNGCSIFYVAKQGAYQMKLLAGALPIEKALRSPQLSMNARKKLLLITEVREFCQKKLHLSVDKIYKNVNVKWNNIIYNVSASETLAFKPYTWWFPIIGSVPYKGFFDESDADAEVARLKNLGFVTLKRRVGGYSTLGYFSDPVWPSMLELDDVVLVELIIHELTHATLYIPYETPFNESLANFVGKRGARLFYIEKYGEHSPQVRGLDNYYDDEKIINTFFADLYKDLDVLYNSKLNEEEKIVQQKSILEQAKVKYENLPLTVPIKNNNWSRINNAYLLAFKIYNQDERVFVELLAKVDGDYKRFFADLATHSQDGEPFAALARFLKSNPL